MPPSPSPHAFVSFRTSCDRCHYQKLKCIVPDSAEVPNSAICCQRCARAKVSCVFGRRKRSRGPGDAEWRQSRRKTGTMRTSDGHGVPVVIAKLPSLLCQSPSASGVPMTPERDALASDSIWSRETCMPGLTVGEDDPLAYEVPEHGSLDSLPLFNNGDFSNDMSLSAQRLECDTGELDWTSYGVVLPSSATRSGDDPSCSGFAASETGTTCSDRCAMVRSLLNLVSDLHEGLEVLENGPWRRGGGGGTCQALDDYPIGSVLSLFQKFIHEATAASASGSSSCIDTSIVLMLLSCYVTLIRICTTALSHFQNHLSLDPPTTGMLEVGPTVCLGELPATKEAYSRTHIAVCMVLDSLGQAEDAFGLPHQLRCAAAGGSPGNHKESNHAEAEAISGPAPAPAPGMGWDLTGAPIRLELEELTSADSIQEGFNALGKKVVELKELLRQKCRARMMIR